MENVKLQDSRYRRQTVKRFFANISTMKNNEQSGFITMIVIMVVIVIAIVGFAVYRIMNANSSVPGAQNNQTIYTYKI